MNSVKTFLCYALVDQLAKKRRHLCLAAKHAEIFEIFVDQLANNDRIGYITERHHDDIASFVGFDMFADAIIRFDDVDVIWESVFLDRIELRPIVKEVNVKVH